MTLFKRETVDMLLVSKFANLYSKFQSETCKAKMVHLAQFREVISPVLYHRVVASTVLCSMEFLTLLLRIITSKFDSKHPSRWQEGFLVNYSRIPNKLRSVVQILCFHFTLFRFL